MVMISFLITRARLYVAFPPLLVLAPVCRALLPSPSGGLAAAAATLLGALQNIAEYLFI